MNDHNLKQEILDLYSSMTKIYYIDEAKTEYTVVMPVFMADGDSVEVYVEKNDDGFILSDEGETFSLHISKYGFNPPPEEAKERIVKELKTANCEFDGVIIIRHVEQEANLPHAIYHFANAIAQLTYEEINRGKH